MTAAEAEALAAFEALAKPHRAWIRVHGERVELSETAVLPGAIWEDPAAAEAAELLLLCEGEDAAALTPGRNAQIQNGAQADGPVWKLRVAELQQTEAKRMTFAPARPVAGAE